MTDTSYPLPTVTGHEYNVSSLSHSAPIVDHQRHALPLVDGTQDDDGQISCICGYFDDDGWTVQCDRCNRWQHQLCYYREYEDRPLPEDLQHYCHDCHPQHVDHQGARIRQQVRREEQASHVNGIQRQPPKSHKKKVKEPVYTNGWPLDKSRHDRNSASPRDQPPPAKRPKTSHRPSESVASASVKGHSRKRNTSNVHHRRSQSRSPETPTELYTERFMQCYLEDDWDIINVNLMNSIKVSNALSEWLNATEDSFRDMHGHEKTEVLMRWDGDLNDIPGRAQIDIEERHDDRFRDDDGNRPTWKKVTVKDSVALGAYIGELKGHVGFREDYQRESANRWSLLRHPEPFVFFHPRLPIYIDARSEGTELRYIRRSCQPNAKLQVLVTDSTDYRFCFMATEQIDPGMEVAVAWDTGDSVPDFHGKQAGLSESDLDHLCSWVSHVLANTGPCACNLPENECLMSRFDRRGQVSNNANDASSVKAPKSKKRKAAQHISPLDTHITSRSGSEARRADPDDEQSDSRSASGSAGRDSASRDITPNTHYSHNGSLSAIPELSERERKKLAKEEEMFRRQEEEQSGKSGKKKRNSGSNLNTPSATSSKQLGFGALSRYADASTSKQMGLPSAKAGRKSKGSSGVLKSPGTPLARGVKRPKPEYVDSEAQCDMDAEEEARLSPPSPIRKPFLSTTQRLLHRCALNNARRKGPAAVAEAERLIKDGDCMDVDRVTPEPIPKSLAPKAEQSVDEPELVLRSDVAEDTEMKDVGPVADTAMQPGSSQTMDNRMKPTTPPVPTHSPSDLPALLWPSQAAHSHQENTPPESSHPHPHKPAEMHLQMPPPPANPFAVPPALLNTTSSGGGVVQSPASLGSGSASIFSPSVTAAVAPSPAKKKMSLSDYTKRNKARPTDVKEAESKSESGRDSSPALVEMAEVAKDNESAVIDGEDVKMEDVSEVVAATTG